MYEFGEEDGFLSVCAVLFGLTARNVSVSVSTIASRDAEGIITQVMLTTRGVLMFLSFLQLKETLKLQLFSLHSPLSILRGVLRFLL